jgi:hypothetical protein
MSIASFVTSLLLAVAPQTGQDPVTDLPDLVVQGTRRGEEAAVRFVDRVVEPPFGVRALAVWRKPLCIEVDNVSERASNALRVGIAARAADVGVELGPEGCRPNVIILATSDGAATARRLVDENGRAFRPSDAFTHLDGRWLDRFRNGDDPVRWWTISLPVDSLTGVPVVSPRGDRARFGGLNLHGPSLHWDRRVRYDMTSVFIVLDASRTADVPISALADYIAFTVLAQTDASADYSGLPTIMNLFQPGSAQELTAWDQAYLRALYESRGTWTSVSRHQRDIARRMVAEGSDQAE